LCFLFQAEDGIRDRNATGVQTCALPISRPHPRPTTDRGTVHGSAPWGQGAEPTCVTGFLDTLKTVSAQENPPSEKFSATPEKVRPRARVTALLLRVHPVTWPVSLAVLGLLGAVVLHLFDPTDEGNLYPKCPFLL